MKSFLPVLIACAMFGVSACAAQPVNRVSEAPLQTVSIELERYLGHWHEAALLPNRFERDCIDAEAHYAQGADGEISVVNTCHKADGETRDARGRARIVGEGKLEVSFFGPFWGDYWVLERAPDYSWSIVGEPRGRYLWVLTRSDTITPEQRADFERRLSALGYDVSKLVWRET